MKKLLLLSVLFALCALRGEVSAQTTHTFTLSWQDNATNEDGTRVERCAGAGCTNFAEVFSLVGANLVSMKDTVPNTGAGELTYCYRVRAFNAQGFSAYSNTACGVTAKILLPPNGNPSGLTVAAISSSTLELSWADNATNESAQRLAHLSFKPQRLEQIAIAADRTSYRHAGLKRNSTHCYTVTAVNGAGESAPSNQSCATTRR